MQMTMVLHQTDTITAQPHGEAMLTVDTVDAVTADARAVVDASALIRFVYQ